MVADRLIVAMVADIPESGIDAFQRYEDHVLPLLPRHGGRLERRLRSADGKVELHIVSFESREGFEAYIDDPDRADHRALLTGVNVVQRVHELHDVGGQLYPR
jgi:hypothetical protein